jgi:hypothetical protein
MSESTQYYVYVYIDPRNFEEFYYGKGVGSRKEAHLSDEADTDKTRRIREIKEAGLSPIIRVVASNLTEHEAFLIEKTLIWKLGKLLTNKSSGYFAEKFRPHNTYHKHLPGFDYQNGIYYVNVGQGAHRAWADCQKYGFLSAGHGPRFRDQIKGLQPGDVVVAYLKNKGYVGVGRVLLPAVPVGEFRSDGSSLRSQPLACPAMFEEEHNLDLCEYVVSVKWIKSVSADKAAWKANAHPKLFTSQLVRASLANQQPTLEFVGKAFGVNFAQELGIHPGQLPPLEER